MNRNLGVVFLVVIVTLGIMSTTVRGGEEYGVTEEEHDYIELVMNVFRFHIKALDLLHKTDTKYSDNVVRHANALWHTSGLLDHIYPDEGAVRGRDWPWKNKKEFDQRVKDNRNAIKKLRLAAQNWLKDGERAKFVKAIENVKESCRNCHGMLRDWP